MYKTKNELRARTGLRSMAGMAIMVLFAFVGFAGASGISQQDDDLPSGEKVIAKYVEATGGQAAYDKIKNRVVESTLEIKGQGITLSVTVYAAKPNKMYVIAESDATGKVERGVIDGVVWEKSLMAGAQVKEGDERADVLRDAAFDRFAYWQQTYEKVECVSIDTVNAKPCYKVVMTPKQGAAQSFYFDKESGLLEMAESEIRSQMGTLPIKAILSDYKEVDGLLISHHLKVEIMGQTRIATTNSVRHNVDLPADRFDPPEDVKALLEKK